MRHEVAGLVAAEDDDAEVGIGLHALDECAQLFDAVRVQQVDRAVVEGHAPVRSRDRVDVELFHCGPLLHTRYPKVKT